MFLKLNYSNIERVARYTNIKMRRENILTSYNKMCIAVLSSDTDIQMIEGRGKEKKNYAQSF